MRVEFSSQSATDALNPAVNPAGLRNLYREPVVPGGKGQFQLRAVLGMTEFAALGRVFMRDMVEYGDDLLVVCGGVLSRITAGGAVLDVGPVGNGEASMAVNTGVLTVASAGGYYAFDGVSLTTPATGAITDVGSVAYLGSYTILTERGGRRIQWSALADPTSFNGLDFASAETTDKPILRAMVWRDVLVVFKQDAIEQWARTGQAGPDAFQRILGGDEQVGLRSFGLVTALPDGLSFVGNDGRVYLFAGQKRPISTPPVEVALTENEPERMFFYEHRGHGFICITFRRGVAWCFDIATGEWHERAEAGGPWTARQSVKWRNSWWVGSDIGKIARLDPICADFGQVMIREATSLPLLLDRPFRVPRVEIFPRVGVDRQDVDIELLDDGVSLLSYGGLALGYFTAGNMAAAISLMESADGIQFGPEDPRSVGEIGEHGRKVEWRNRGWFDGMACFRLRLSSVLDLPVASAAEVVVA